MMAIKTQDKKNCGKRYSDEEKKEIVNYYEKMGFNETLTNFGISSNSLNTWIKKSTSTPTSTSTPKRDIMEEIMQRRRGLNEQKQTTTPTSTSTSTPTTSTSTPTTSIAPTTPVKVNRKEPNSSGFEITPTSTPTSTKLTSTSTKITPTTNSLTFEQIVEKLIACSKNSNLRDNKMIAKAFEGKGNNPLFQSKRIKDAIRLLLDSGVRFVQEA